MILYRPVGSKELELIAESGFTKFPPRLYWQAIFYPVLTVEYAERIARDWNTNDENSGWAGFVTQFEVADAFVSRYEVHEAGGRDLQELWVPVDELDEFNRHILGRIEVTAAYYGGNFDGEVDPETNLPVNVSHRLAEVLANGDLIDAHRHSTDHRDELFRSEVCGCFYCRRTFSPNEISRWIDKDEGGVCRTALCPYCEIDSVIGSGSGFPISPEFLTWMHRYWF